jgi:predicted enzyme related to lactoylglutathione lyase
MNWTKEQIMTTYTHAKPAGAPTWSDLLAPDVDAARAFYHAIFGWDYDIGGPEYGGYTTARLGTRMTVGMSGPPPGVALRPAAWALYFATEDIEADVARAVQLGAKVLNPPMVVGAFGSMATLEDPTGAAFSFWRAEQHVGWQVTDEPGSTTWYELYSPDAKAARDFYAALLGATADPMPGGLEYYVLKHGEEMLGGVMQIDPAWGGMHPQWAIYFSVANADETAAAIIEHGGKVMGNVDDSPFGRLAAVMDPSGAMFKIIQPPAR